MKHKRRGTFQCYPAESSRVLLLLKCPLFTTVAVLESSCEPMDERVFWLILLSWLQHFFINQVIPKCSGSVFGCCSWYFCSCGPVWLHVFCLCVSAASTRCCKLESQLSVYAASPQRKLIIMLFGIRRLFFSCESNKRTNKSLYLFCIHQSDVTRWSEEPMQGFQPEQLIP